MSFSDFILAILILAGIACLLWIMDINPYSNKLQVYNQTCTEMILDNSFCKGKWLDDPVITYNVDKKNNLVTTNSEPIDSAVTYHDCLITNRKNWSCANEQNDGRIQAIKGDLRYENIEVSDKQQITRFKWLQNKLLTLVSS